MMRAAISGDTRAYRDFLAAVAPILRMLTRRNLARYGSVEADVEDIVQETLLAIHLKRYTWDSNRPIRSWIAAISRNKLVDALRRRGSQAEFHRRGIPIRRHPGFGKLSRNRSPIGMSSIVCLRG